MTAVPTTARRRASRRPGHWRILGANVPGDSHCSRGLPAQDAFQFAEVPAGGGATPAYVLAVADGAGSRQRSGEAAHLAVGNSVDIVTSRLRAQPWPGDALAWRRLVAESFAQTRHRLLRVVDVLGCQPSDFTSTLTLVVLCGRYVATASIGDCFLVARIGRDEKAKFHLIDTEAKKVGGQITPATVFLTSPECESEARSTVMEDREISGLLLATDGLETPFLRRSTAGDLVRADWARRVISFFDNRSQLGSPELLEFLLGKRLERYTRDDKTLLVAVPA